MLRTRNPTIQMNYNLRTRGLVHEKKVKNETQMKVPVRENKKCCDEELVKLIVMVFIMCE